MKWRAVRNKSVFFTALSMLILYLTSTVGFSIHTCNCSRYASLVISYSSDVCSHEHEEDESCACGFCCEQELSGDLPPVEISAPGCCSSNFYRIDSDQLDSRDAGTQLSLPVMTVRSFEHSFQPAENILSYADSRFVPEYVDISTFCSQWRI